MVCGLGRGKKLSSRGTDSKENKPRDFQQAHSPRISFSQIPNEGLRARRAARTQPAKHTVTESGSHADTWKLFLSKQNSNNNRRNNQKMGHGVGEKSARERGDFINISIIESKTVFNCQNSINTSTQAGPGKAGPTWQQGLHRSVSASGCRSGVRFHGPLPSWAIWAIGIDC